MRTALAGARLGLVLALAVFGGLFAGDAQQVAEASPDIPIVWRLPAPPNFWLCSVGLSGGANALPSMAPDASKINAALIGQPGYLGGLPPGGRNWRVWGAGSDATPTLGNVAGCINMFDNAAPGDVAVFYISTHGDRTIFDGAPADEPADDEPNGQPGTLLPPAGPTDERLVLLGGGGAAFLVSDDAFASLWTSAPPLPAGVSVIAIFDHPHPGHADGSADLAATLAGLGNSHALLMAAERQYPTLAILGAAGGHLTSGNPDPYRPGAQLQAGAFTNYLRKGLAITFANAGCVGGLTTQADGVAGNNDCITTGRELFDFTAQPTANLVGDDDLDGTADDPVGDVRVDAEPDGPFFEDPPEFYWPISVNNDVDAFTDEDGVSTNAAAGECVLDYTIASGCRSVAAACPGRDWCRQYPKLVDVEPTVPVGGLAELPEISGSSGPPYAALAGGLAAAVLALTAGAWYARRRWVR